MPADFGLAKIAKHLGKEEAVAVLWEAEALEEIGDCNGAIKLYRRAYKMWDALDSGYDHESGLPRRVREAAETSGINCAPSAEKTMEREATPRFAVTATGEWLSYLEEFGYCVLADVADDKAVAQAKSLMWDFLESVPQTQVKRNDTTTWGIKDDWKPSQSNGILGTLGFGQSAFCWHTRLLPAVKQAFAAIWGCQNLIVSFDGGNVFRPWAARPEWKTEGGWWHVDYNHFLPNEDGAEDRMIQGLVTFADATPATGGLCVLPGSHKQHKEVCERARASKLSSHFVSVRPGDPVFELGARLVCAKAGDLVLWDSRCVHCNTPGVKETKAAIMDGVGDGDEAAVSIMSNPDSSSAVPKDANVELLRVAGYVCMTPAAWASHDVLAKRRDAFINNETIDHWPHKYHGMGVASKWLSPKKWNDANIARRLLVVGASSPLLAKVQDGSENAVGLCGGVQPKELAGTRNSQPSTPPARTCSNKTMEDFEQLDAHLELNSYILPSRCASVTDYNRCELIKLRDIDASKLPHLYRWHSHISYLMARFGKFDLGGNPIAGSSAAS